MSASNSIHDVDDAGSLTKTLPVRIGLTLVLMVLAGIVAMAVTLTGGLAKEVGDVVGLGDTAVDRMGHRQGARAPVPRERPAGGALLGRAERQAAVPPVLARGPVWPWWAG